METLQEAARALLVAMKATFLEDADGSDPRYWPEFTALEDALAAQSPLSQPDAGLGALAKQVLEAAKAATPGPWTDVPASKPDDALHNPAYVKRTFLDADGLRTHQILAMLYGVGPNKDRDPDCAFIALSRTAAPDLAVGYLALQERVRALEEHPVSAHCVYCKRDMDMADTASAEVAMVSHAKTCAAHPLRAAERLAQERGEALARLRATLEKPPILPSGYQYGQDARELYDFGWKQAMAEARAALAQAARPSAAAEKG